MENNNSFDSESSPEDLLAADDDQQQVVVAAASSASPVLSLGTGSNGDRAERSRQRGRRRTRELQLFREGFKQQKFNNDTFLQLAEMQQRGFTHGFTQQSGMQLDTLAARWGVMQDASVSSSPAAVLRPYNAIMADGADTNSPTVHATATANAGVSSSPAAVLRPYSAIMAGLDTNSPTVHATATSSPSRTRSPSRSPSNTSTPLRLPPDLTTQLGLAQQPTNPSSPPSSQQQVQQLLLQQLLLQQQQPQPNPGLPLSPGQQHHLPQGLNVPLQQLQLLLNDQLSGVWQHQSPGQQNPPQPNQHLLLPGSSSDETQYQDRYVPDANAFLHHHLQQPVAASLWASSLQSPMYGSSYRQQSLNGTSGVASMQQQQQQPRPMIGSAVNLQKYPLEIISSLADMVSALETDPTNPRHAYTIATSAGGTAATTSTSQSSPESYTPPKKRAKTGHSSPLTTLSEREATPSSNGLDPHVSTLEPPVVPAATTHPTSQPPGDGTFPLGNTRGSDSQAMATYSATAPFMPPGVSIWNASAAASPLQALVRHSPSSLTVYTAHSPALEHEAEVQATSLRLFNKTSPTSMVAANQIVDSATKRLHDQRTAEMQYVSIAQNVTQSARSSMIDAGSLYLQGVQLAQQGDHHNETMAMEADQHNEQMAHAENIEQRSKLKEERLLLKQRFTGYSKTACGLFWFCALFVVALLLDYHWNHALDDFCSYAEKLNWLHSVAQWMTSVSQSRPISYLMSAVFSYYSNASDEVCSVHSLECMNASCPAALTSVFFFGLTILSMMMIAPNFLKAVISVLVSLVLLYKTSESTANQVVFYHLLVLVFLKVVVVGLVWFAVDAQYHKESVEEVVNARNKFPFYMKLLCFCYVLPCVNACVMLYGGWLA